MTVGANTNGRLAGKVALVTGASQGIGSAIALAFAQEGARVIATSRSVERLGGTVRASAGAVEPRRCDVTNAGDVADTVAFAEAEFGALHVLVNNAGVAYTATLPETSEEVWESTMATNAKGTFLGCKYAIPAMIRAGGGSIVNVGSIASFLGERLSSAYAASKGAVLMLTKCAAREYAGEGVRVNALCPGATITPMQDAYLEALGGSDAGMRWMSSYQPLTGLLAPEQVARAAVFLASDDSAGMTGSAVVVDGGLSAAWDHGPGPTETPGFTGDAGVGTSDQ